MNIQLILLKTLIMYLINKFSKILIQVVNINYPIPMIFKILIYIKIKILNFLILIKIILITIIYSKV